MSTSVSGSDNNDIDPEDRIFKDSTHQYLVYFGKTNDCVGFVIALAVILIQWVLYGIFIEEAFKLFNEDRVTVEVEWGADCNDVNTSLICESEVSDAMYAVLGYVLLAFYLMGDVIGGIRAFFFVSGLRSKIGAILVVASAILAGYTGSLFAYQGIYSGSRYNALANCIGVIFVSDIDEKVFWSLGDVKFGKNLKNCCSCFCCECCDSLFKIICIAICLVVFVVIGYVTQFVLDDSYYNV
eukprot:91173_1